MIAKEDMGLTNNTLEQQEQELSALSPLASCPGPLLPFRSLSCSSLTFLFPRFLLPSSCPTPLRDPLSDDLNQLAVDLLDTPSAELA